MTEIVIKISDDMYQAIKDDAYCGILRPMLSAIRNGIVLPKGHGRLIDADAVLEEPIGNTYKDIDIAETIIEADKEE